MKNAQRIQHALMCLHALAQPNATPDELRAVGLPQQHFVKARHREQLAVRREIERRNHRRTLIHGRMARIDLLPRVLRRSGTARRGARHQTRF